MGIVRSAFVVDEKGKLAGVFYKVSPKDTVPKAEAARSKASVIEAQRVDAPLGSSKLCADGVVAAVDVDASRRSSRGRGRRAARRTRRRPARRP